MQERQKEDFKENCRALSLVEPNIGIRFPLWRRGRALDKRRREKDRQGLTSALQYPRFTLSAGTNDLFLVGKVHRPLNTNLLFPALIRNRERVGAEELFPVTALHQWFSSRRGVLDVGLLSSPSLQLHQFK